MGDASAALPRSQVLFCLLFDLCCRRSRSEREKIIGGGVSHEEESRIVVLLRFNSAAKLCRTRC